MLLTPRPSSPHLNHSNRIIVHRCNLMRRREEVRERGALGMARFNHYRCVAFFSFQSFSAAFVFVCSLTLISAFNHSKTGYGAPQRHSAGPGQLPQYGAMQGHAPPAPPGYQQQPYGQQQQAYGQQQGYGANRAGMQGGGGPGFGGPGVNVGYGTPRGPPGGFAPQRPMGQYQGSAPQHAPQYGAQSNSGWR